MEISKEDYADVTARLVVMEMALKQCPPKRFITIIAQLLSEFVARFPSQHRQDLLKLVNDAVETVIPIHEQRVFGDAGHPGNLKTTEEPSPTPTWKAVAASAIDIEALVDAGEIVESVHVWHRLDIDEQTVWIEPRPSYCNRGRYHAQYSGTMHIDAGDGFPRYFMDLDVAKSEMKAWLLHRMQCERARS